MQQFVIDPWNINQYLKLEHKYNAGRRPSKIRNSLWYRNLLACYQKATPEQITSGKAWYQAAKEFADVTSTAYKLTPYVVAQVISALSPAAKWERNLIDAKRICEAYYHRGYIGANAVTVTTYGKNKAKALQILLGKLELSPKQGLKTYNFAQNIADPSNANHVTIDRHAYRILTGDGQRGEIKLTPQGYARASHVYKLLAKDLGLTPCELQAITWVVYREGLK